VIDLTIELPHPSMWRTAAKRTASNWLDPATVPHDALSWRCRRSTTTTRLWPGRPCTG